MTELFRMPEVESGIIRKARFDAGELFFVPYYLINAKRIGIFTKKTLPSPQYKVRYEVDYRLGSGMAVRKEKIPTWQSREKEVDSRVVMNDLIRSFTAINLPNWGIDEIDPIKIMNEKELTPISYNRAEMEKYGTVLEPRISAEQRIEEIFNRPELGFVQDNTEIAEKRISILYYPIWRIRWRYQDRTFHTSIDGITGKIIHSRAPARQGSRLLWLLAISSAVGFSVGKLIKMPFLILGGGALGLWILLFFIAGLLFFVALGWNMVRYSSELVIYGDEKYAEWIGRPKETFFDRLAEGMGRFLGEMTKNLPRNRYGW